MSYCVHCGVELAVSERDCPLCGTEVVNPRCAWERPEQLPYPETVDVKDAHIDRRYARQLVAMVMAVPALIVLLVDWVDGGGLRWSPYVVGALVLIYCWVVVPLLFKLSRPYAYVAVDFVSLGAYLLLIAAMTGGLNWFVQLVLPLLALCSAALSGAILALRRLEWPLLDRMALCCAILGIFLLLLEVLISLYAGVPVRLAWSIYATIPLDVIALMMLFVERNKRMKQEIRKRLFL